MAIFKLMGLLRRRLAEHDERAIARGLTVERLPWGGRRYHDPRWSQRRAAMLDEPAAAAEVEPVQLVGGELR